MFGTPDTPKFLALLEALNTRAPTQGCEKWSSPSHNHYISSRRTNFQKDRIKDKKMNDNKFILAKNSNRGDGDDDPDLEHANKSNRTGRLTDFDEHTPSTTLLTRIFSRSRPKPEVPSWALLENQELPSIASIKASLFPNRDASEEQVDQLSKLDQEEERRKKILPAPLTMDEMRRRSELGMTNEDGTKNTINQSSELQMLRRRLESERLLRESELMTAKFRSEFEARKESFSHRREYRIEQAQEHEKIHQLEKLKNYNRSVGNYDYYNSPCEYQLRFDTKASLALNHEEIDPIAAAAMKRSETQEIGEKYLGRKSVSLVDVARTGRMSNLAIIKKFVEDFSGASPDWAKRKISRRNSAEGVQEVDEVIEVDEELENCQKEIEEAFSEQRSRFSKQKKQKTQTDDQGDEIDVGNNEKETFQETFLVGKLTSDLILMLKQIQEQTYLNGAAENEKILTSSRGRGEKIEKQCLIDLIAAGFTNLSSLHVNSSIAIIQRNNDDDDEAFLIRFLQKAASCFSDNSDFDPALIDEIYKTIISVETRKIMTEEARERKITRDEQRVVFKNMATDRAKQYQILAASLFMKRLRDEQERKEALELAKKQREDEEEEKRRIESETLIFDSARERQLIADSQRELEDIISSSPQEEQSFVADPKNPKINSRLSKILEAVTINPEDDDNFIFSPSRRNIGDWRKRQQEIDAEKSESVRQVEKRERDELEIMKTESEKVLNSSPTQVTQDLLRSRRSPPMDSERNLVWPSLNKKLVGDSIVARPLRRALRSSGEAAKTDPFDTIPSADTCFVDNHHNRVRSRFALLRDLAQAERTRRELSLQDRENIVSVDNDNKNEFQRSLYREDDHSFGILVPSQSVKRNIGGFMAAPSFFDKLIVDTASEYGKKLVEMKCTNHNNENDDDIRDKINDENNDGEVSLRLTKGTHRSRLIEKIREEVVSKVAKERSSASANSVGVGTRFGRSI